MLTGFKSPWSSKTILTAVAMGLSLLGTIGVKWFTDSQNVKHAMDVIDAVIAVLGSTGVIAFRATATKQVTTDAAKVRSSSSPTVLLPLLLLALAPFAHGCQALGLQPGQSVVASTPAGRADQALSLYSSTLHELNQLRQEGQLSDEVAKNVIEPARAAAWAAVTAMCAQAQVSPAEDTKAFEDAAASFAKAVARMIAAKLAPKQQAASPSAPATRPTAATVAAEAPPPQAVEVPLGGP